MGRLAALLVGVLVCLPGQAVERGEPAPLFVAPDLRGSGSIALADFAGQVVYVDFWASWCAPCRESLPLLAKLHAELAEEGFAVVAIDIDEHPDDGLRFLQRYPVGYPVASDPLGRVASQYKLRVMPSSFLIDRDGIVRYVHEGFKQADMARIRAQVLTYLRAD